MNYGEIRSARSLINMAGDLRGKYAEEVIKLLCQALDALEAKMDQQTSEASSAFPELSERAKVFVGNMIRQRDDAKLQVSELKQQAENMVENSLTACRAAYKNGLEDGQTWTEKPKEEGLQLGESRHLPFPRPIICCCDKVPPTGGYCQVHPDLKRVVPVPICASCHGAFPGHQPGCPFGYDQPE